MRIVGAVLYIFGLALCFSIEGWEPIGLIPMGLGVAVLAIAEREARDPTVEEGISSEMSLHRKLLRPSRNRLPEKEELPISVEIELLLERLSRLSRKSSG
jgi:hypothetical protein